MGLGKVYVYSYDSQHSQMFVGSGVDNYISDYYCNNEVYIITQNFPAGCGFMVYVTTFDLCLLVAVG